MPENKEGRNFFGWPLPGKLPRFLWLGLAALLGVVLLSLSNLAGGSNSSVLSGEGRSQPGRPPASLPAAAGGLNRTENELAQSLEEILGRVEGVGRVKITLLLASGPEYQYAVNTVANRRTIEEKEQGGGMRTTSEHNENGQLVLARSAQGNLEEPVVMKETKPRVQGVLVVAEGANSSLVQARLTAALETLLKVAAHQIQVLPMEGR